MRVLSPGKLRAMTRIAGPRGAIAADPRFEADEGRLRALSALADAYATPWTARCGDPASGPAARAGWHVTYGE